MREGWLCVANGPLPPLKTSVSTVLQYYSGNFRLGCWLIMHRGSKRKAAGDRRGAVVVRGGEVFIAEIVY